MSGRIVLESKNIAETKKYIFDFISQLVIGTTISTASVVAAVWTGVDASPSSIVSGSASISGTTVAQAITGGVEGTIYKLTCTITTSDSQTVTLVAYLPIVSNPL